MKLSERWLREWVDPPADAVTIADRINRAGVEATAEQLMAQLPVGVVVARIESLEPHPQADRLKVCSVDDGGSAPAWWSRWRSPAADCPTARKFATVCCAAWLPPACSAPPANSAWPKPARAC
jgi:tRNA-binding EMAP/Myf-like protein